MRRAMVGVGTAEVVTGAADVLPEARTRLEDPGEGPPPHFPVERHDEGVTAPRLLQADVAAALASNRPTIPLERPDKRHLPFGRGPHVCVGAPLARAELRLALEVLLGRTTSITLTERDDAVIPTGNEMTSRIHELNLDINS